MIEGMTIKGVITTTIIRMIIKSKIKTMINLQRNENDYNLRCICICKNIFITRLSLEVLSLRVFKNIEVVS